jgi:hypothetical protein
MSDSTLSTGTDEPIDPFDLDALKSAPLQDLDLERVLTTVPVRRPGRTEFFRVHPGPDYVVDSYVLEHTNGLDRETYWVARGLHLDLVDELRAVRLYTCITKRGTVFLWPARLPLADGSNSGRAWHQSALQAAEEAKNLWVKLVGNKELGAYEFVKARGDLGEPQWPEKTYRELVELAFKDRVISTLEHPVIRDLYGDI